MKKVIFDCDNTMGIKNRDIDDGLALIYLLERNDVELLGITTTYGNDSVDNVYKKTETLLKDIQMNNISVVKGKGSNFEMKDYVDLSYNKSDIDEQVESAYSNEAARFIIDKVNKLPGEISILATGSLQNIYDAIMIDNTISDKIKEIVIMGGITGPLQFGDRIMNELNFTVCKEGAFHVLNRMKNLSVLTGNNCMDSRFGIDNLEDSREISSNSGKNIFLLEKIENWMKDFKNMYNCDYIVLWDVIAAIYIVEPGLFKDKIYGNSTSLHSLENGSILVDPKCKKGNIINIPEIKDSEKLSEHMIDIIFRGN